MTTGLIDPYPPGAIDRDLCVGCGEYCGELLFEDKKEGVAI